MKKSWNILICILINFGCSKEIAIEDNETLYDESNRKSKNLKAFDYEIEHFSDKHAEVRKSLERQKYYKSHPIKVFMSSTEWEITLHLHDFDEFWKRYALGKS